MTHNHFQNAMMNAWQNPAAVQPTAVQPTPMPQVPNLSSLIKDTVSAEIAKLKAELAQSTPAAQPQSPVSLNPAMGILPVLGAALSEEEQVWLSQPGNLMGLPGFLMSKSGKDLIRMALGEYKSFIGS